MITMVPGREGLSEHGIANVRGRIYWQPTTSQLYMHALSRGDAALASIRAKSLTLPVTLAFDDAQAFKNLLEKAVKR